MSVMLGIQWENSEYECGNSISQDTARSIAVWARDEGLPLLEQIQFNGWPQFTPENITDLIAEFEQYHRHYAEQHPTAFNIADVFLPRLRELRNQDGWAQGDFG